MSSLPSENEGNIIELFSRNGKILYIKKVIALLSCSWALRTRHSGIRRKDCVDFLGNKMASKRNMT